MNIMSPYIEASREIICFSISGEMSTSGNVIRMAAEELKAEDAVTVIDSRNLSTGIGLLVVEAAIYAPVNNNSGVPKLKSRGNKIVEIIC